MIIDIEYETDYYANVIINLRISKFISFFVTKLKAAISQQKLQLSQQIWLRNSKIEAFVVTTSPIVSKDFHFFTMQSYNLFLNLTIP